MRKILIGAAAIALAAGGAHAQPGNGKGQGSDKGNTPSAAHKGGPADRPGSAAKADKGNGPGKAIGNKAEPMAKGKPANAGNGHAMKTAGNGNSALKSNGNGRSDVEMHKYDRRDETGRKMKRGDGDFFDFAYRNTRVREHGLINGCPPGLAKKRNGCNPPGLVKQDYRYDRASWWGLPGLIDGRYRYYDNNLVRLSPNGSILGYYPLLGGALSAGNLWPNWFAYEPVPTYYENYYGLGPSGSYRYADDVLYRVDPETAAITSVAALLTGDTIQVGQRMPRGYDVYNVPYAYRDRYADGPDARYRYSDGYVYQIDPTTNLVASAIQLLL